MLVMSPRLLCSDNDFYASSVRGLITVAYGRILPYLWVLLLKVNAFLIILSHFGSALWAQGHLLLISISPLLLWLLLLRFTGHCLWVVLWDGVAFTAKFSMFGPKVWAPCLLPVRSTSLISLWPLFTLTGRLFLAHW